MSRYLLLLSVVGIFACGDKGSENPDPVFVWDPEPEEPACDTTIDLDCDGVIDEEDCDPEDPFVHPGMDEIPYDGKDNDCAGDLNDVDGDGYIGEQGGGDDCNDGNPNAHPGAEEICYDAIDDDCDGEAQGYEDNDCDGDGYKDRGEEGDDCDAEDATVHPGADEIWYDGVDQDCNYESDYDADLDGEDSSDYGGTDCDDTNPDLNLANPEVWDGDDDNCNVAVDDLTADEAWASIEGPAGDTLGNMGWSMAVVGDHDGDGVDDVLVGAPTSDSDQGWLHLLSVDEGNGKPEDVTLGRVQGQPNSQLGWDLTAADDLNDDGLVEVIVGAPGTGEAFVISGSSLAEGDVVAPTVALNTLSLAIASFGGDVSILGDLDSDGMSEIVIGTGALSTTWVSIWDGGELLESGADPIVTIEGNGQGGESIGGADFDGDTIPDLVIADDTDSTGRVAIFTALQISQIAASGGMAVFDDSPAILHAGEGVRGALHSGYLTDMDGDGYGELLFSAQDADAEDGTDGAGVVYIIRGDHLSDYDELAEAGGDLAILADVVVSGQMEYGAMIPSDRGSDFDGDGLSDLLVSNLGDTDQAAMISKSYVLYGADISAGGSYTTDDAGSSFKSNSTADWAGYTGIGSDLDDDGDADLILGAPEAGVGAGSVFIYQSQMVD